MAQTCLPEQGRQLLIATQGTGLPCPPGAAGERPSEEISSKNKPPDLHGHTQSLWLPDCVQKSFPTYMAWVCKDGMRKQDDKTVSKRPPGPGPSLSSQKELAKSLPAVHTTGSSADGGASPSKRTQSKPPHAHTQRPQRVPPAQLPQGHGLSVVLPDAAGLGSLASLKTLLTCGRQKATIHSDFIHDCMDAAS